MTKKKEPHKGAVLGWHFTAGKVLRNGAALIPRAFEWYVDPACKKFSPSICSRGLHASPTILDALPYAPGATLHRVAVRGDVSHDAFSRHKKFCGRERVIIYTVRFLDLFHGVVSDALNKAGKRALFQSEYVRESDFCDHARASKLPHHLREANRFFHKIYHGRYYNEMHLIFCCMELLVLLEHPDLLGPDARVKIMEKVEADAKRWYGQQHTIYMTPQSGITGEFMVQHGFLKGITAGGYPDFDIDGAKELWLQLNGPKKKPAAKKKAAAKKKPATKKGAENG